MPFGLRKRSWEDHVTPRSRKQYSYDDLDLDCCHDAAGGAGSPRKSQRERCSSMPECHHHQPDVGTHLGEGGDGLPSNYEGEDGPLRGMVRPAKSDKDIDQSSESSAGQGPGPNPSSTFNGIPAKDHDHAFIATPSALNMEEDKNVNSSMGSSFCKLEPKPDHSMMTPKEGLRENPDVAMNNMEDGVDAAVGASAADAHLLRNQELVGMKEIFLTSEEASPKTLATEEEQVSERKTKDTAREVHMSLQITNHDAVAVSEANVMKDTHGRDEMVTSNEVLEMPNPNASIDPEPQSHTLGGTSNADHHRDNHLKLDTIFEVSFSENLDETPGQMMGLELDRDASLDIKQDLKKEVLQGSPGLKRSELVGNPKPNVAELPLDSEPSMTTSDGHVTDLQTRPNMERSKEMEEDSKPQEPLVRYRARKSSDRDEKETDGSQLDSMVLLIMKLDQLDQEIENALSSTSSPIDTPTAERRFIADVDAASLDGSLSGSSLSLGPPRLQSSSSPSSVKNRTFTTSLEKDKAEIEAKEACMWLRAAGFPQYAQLYEDGQFPLEISSVTRDHDFLDRDAIEALCRRLNTLNKCALMKLEITPQRKRSEDSDEDEPCAISGRWTFQRDSKRWSRLDQLDLDIFSPSVGDAVSAPPSQDQHLPGGHLLRERVSTSAENVLTDLSEQPELGSLHSLGSNSRKGSRSITVPSSPASANVNVAMASTTRANSVASVCSSGTSGANEDSLSDCGPSPLEHGQFTFDTRTFSGSAGAGKSTRSRAKSFLKRMENLRLRSGSASLKRKKKVAASGGKLEISDPVLKEGLDEEKLRQLNCVDIATTDQAKVYNRSVSYSTQTSSGSTGSSQSETSSGSAVSTPSPVTRTRSSSMTAVSTKRVGMYLEGFDPFKLVQEGEKVKNLHDQKVAELSMTAENNLRNRERQEEDNRAEEVGGVIYFYLPDGHKPGTFPKSLAGGVSVERRHQANSRMPRQDSSTTLDNRLSFYDNVPFPEPGNEEEEPKIEDVLERVTGMQSAVSTWAESGHGDDDDDEEEEEDEGDSDSALDSASPCPSSPLQNCLLEAENGSDQESTGNPQDDAGSARERRDSGVGASLTRANRPQKLRWHSFLSSHRPSVSSFALQLDCQSVLQMNLLQKYSLLKITALLEKHTPTHKHGFSWAVPKFMKRGRGRDWKDRSVFGVPLQVNVRRTGQPLPQGIQQAMRFLRNHGRDQVGLFRKSGVKSRIQALRQMNESCGAEGGGVNYEGQSAYDVADMLKQYFRDLPEPLLTSKASESFLQIYQFIPAEQRVQAARAAVCLMPDESREALQTLLCFLSDVAASVGENQMTCTNLAVCLAPSLFHLNTARRDASSPRLMSRKNTLGKPDQKDLNENLAATHCLTHMIQECRRLFQIPEEVSRCRNSYVEQALVPPRMEELLGDVHGYRSLVEENVEALLKEAKDKFKGYDTCTTPEQAELTCKKVHDGWSLRQWKVCVEVPAGPDEVLQRIAREQERWDEDLLESRVIETLDANTDVYQYVRNNMAPHPPTDYVVLRSWVTDLPKGARALVCVSVEHQGAPMIGVRANVLTSRYLIEPCGPNKSRLTYISRTDRRGRCPEWYNKLYGHLCVSELVRLRDSFTCTLDK